MSDEEGGWMNDDAEENEQEERKETKITDSKPKGPRKEEPVVEKTEAQQILEAKLKKQEEDDSDRIREIEEARRLEREKEDEELRKLKEKQAQRKKERELEDQKLEEQRRQLEEKRRQEEEARKQKTEEDKRRKQEILEQKKAAAQAAMVGGRNFVIEKDKQSGTIDKFMNISKAKTEMSLNTGELQALKMRTINERVKPLALSDLDNAGLKAKAEELWKTIVVLETSKYDLAERATRQEYDLKELNERQRQMNVKKHVAQGLDADAANSRYPPKVQLISKYERRTDRRTFGERKAIFEMEKKRLEELELVKPAAKKREGWVKGKKPAGDDGEENGDEEINGQENEESNQDENQEEEEVQAEPTEEEESIW